MRATPAPESRRREYSLAVEWRDCAWSPPIVVRNPVADSRRLEIKPQSIYCRFNQHWHKGQSGRADLPVSQKAAQQRRPAMSMRQCCFDLPYSAGGDEFNAKMQRRKGAKRRSPNQRNMADKVAQASRPCVSVTGDPFAGTHRRDACATTLPELSCLLNSDRNRPAGKTFVLCVFASLRLCVENLLNSCGLSLFREMPPGNSTGSSHNIVHIDRLTSRAMLEFQKVQ